MNATSLHELRAAQTAAEAEDNRLAKVRDLLIGDHARDMEARVAMLAQRLDALETSVARQLDALEAKIEALAAQQDAGRRGAFTDLSRHVEELAVSIRSLSKS